MLPAELSYRRQLCGPLEPGGNKGHVERRTPNLVLAANSLWREDACPHRNWSRF
jgi:hypothetical protein